jgi:hypothetical protein
MSDYFTFEGLKATITICISGLENKHGGGIGQFQDPVDPKVRWESGRYIRLLNYTYAFVYEFYSGRISIYKYENVDGHIVLSEDLPPVFTDYCISEELSKENAPLCSYRRPFWGGAPQVVKAVRKKMTDYKEVYANLVEIVGEPDESEQVEIYIDFGRGVTLHAAGGNIRFKIDLSLF